jgi:hypothetical protein
MRPNNDESSDNSVQNGRPRRCAPLPDAPGCIPVSEKRDKIQNMRPSSLKPLSFLSSLICLVDLTSGAFFGSSARVPAPPLPPHVAAAAPTPAQPALSSANPTAGARVLARSSHAQMVVVPEGYVKLSSGLKPANEVSVAVYGGGSFGTAMACVLGRKGVKTTLIVRKPEVVEQINTKHINPYYQSDLLLPESVFATLDPGPAFEDADFIFHAVPMQYSRAALEKVAHLVPEGVPVVSLSKGIETSTLCLMSEVLPQCLGTDRGYAFVSGPSFAAEIVQVRFRNG